MMKVEDLITIIAILFLAYFFFVDKKEHLTAEETEKQKNKACSQVSINSGYEDYTFGGKKFVR
jgi:hypothetical protein